MANEKRLIYADVAKSVMEDCELWETEGELETAKTCIDLTPTVEAVEVVRCCDCVSCKVILDNDCAAHYHCKKRYGLPEVDPTDFCSYGERREGE